VRVSNQTPSGLKLILGSVPALFTFLLTTENHLNYMQTVKLSGNALAVVINTSPESDQSDSTQLIVSVDTFHKPGSTTEEWKDADKDTYPLQRYKFQVGKLIQEGVFQVPTLVRDEGDASGSDASGRLTNLLYSLENLRKREGEAQEE
jgi:tRNA (guanine-N(7)-)-methyltransferase subunit TRM82